jgi:autoinducer 2-degrading protein
LYVLIVKLQVKPESRDEFLEAAIAHDARGSVGTEPGCYRFDVIQDETDPNALYFYEVYRDKEAFQAHGKTSHIAQFREASAGMTAAPSVVYRGNSVFPADDLWVKQAT